MKILFLTPQVPYPPEKGTALRNWGLISELARRHDIVVLSFLESGQSLSSAEPLRAICRLEVVPAPARSRSERLRGVLATRQPDMALRLMSPEYAQRLADWLARERFDVVQIEGIEMAPYLDVIDQVSLRPLIIFDDHNCEYVLQKRAFLTDLRMPSRWLGAAYSFIQWRRLQRYEREVCCRVDKVLAVSDADARALRSLIPHAEVTVIPNGIDTRLYSPQSAGTVPPAGDAPVLVFSGTMDFRPNVDAVLWFAREVLPRIQREEPSVQFWVVGQRPHRRLDVLRRSKAITLTGWVKDTRPYLARAAVYVVPLRIGGGTRLKLLEAMALGKAIVATSLGAEGYPVAHGVQLMLADTPEAFAEAVVALLRSPAQRTALGLAARRFVEEQFDWRHIVPRLEEVYACRH